jgi:hypothetical protein
MLAHLAHRYFSLRRGSSVAMHCKKLDCSRSILSIRSDPTVFSRLAFKNFFRSVSKLAFSCFSHSRAVVEAAEILSPTDGNGGINLTS